MKYLIIVFLGCTMFVGCQSTNIVSKEWKLVSVVSADSLLTVGNANKPSTLKIEADNKVSGQGGCNSFAGEVIIDGTKIKFDKVVATQMACLDMTVESAFFAALNNADSYIVESGNLKLKKGDLVIATFTESK
jgi:heat shock protein HslJ